MHNLLHYLTRRLEKNLGIHIARAQVQLQYCYF